MRKRQNVAHSAFSREKVQKDIAAEARALGIPAGAAGPIAEDVAHKIEAWVEKKPMITNEDLNRKISRELEKYHPDLAYVYKNRGRII